MFKDLLLNKCEERKLNEIVIYSNNKELINKITYIMPTEFTIVVKTKRTTEFENVLLVIIDGRKIVHNQDRFKITDKKRTLTAEELVNFSILGALDDQPFVVISHPHVAIPDHITNTASSYEEEFKGYISVDESERKMRALFSDILGIDL